MKGNGIRHSRYSNDNRSMHSSVVSMTSPKSGLKELSFADQAVHLVLTTSLFPVEISG